MRKETDSTRLRSLNVFSLDRLDSMDNFESGSSATLGFDYKFKTSDIDKINFSVGQIINEKEK